MKIWFDTERTNRSTQSDCDCPVYDDQFADTNFLADEEDVHRIPIDSFQQSPLLYMQKYNYDLWILCHPTGSGHIAILDVGALFLLEQFQAPTTVSQVMQTVAGWSLETVENTVLLFLKLGFLHNLSTSSFAKKRDTIQTLTAWMHVTNACNLRCPYCYLNKTPEHMTDDTAHRAIDAIFRSAIKHKFTRVKLKYAGGEASLHMKHVTDIHSYAAQLAQQYGVMLDAILLSNGVVLSQRAIDALKAHQIKVMISLDGLGTYHDSQRPFINGHGSFQYVNCTINRLLASSLVPLISITVSRRNLDGLPSLIKYVLEREMPFTINYYRENECSTHIDDLRFEEAEMIAAMRSAFRAIEEHLPKESLLDALIDRARLNVPHHHTCGVGHAYLVTDQNGGIAKCHADITRRITTVDVDDPLQMVRDDRDGVQGIAVDDKEGCKACEWRYWCTGGCPLLTYKATGRYDVKSPNCNIYKALFPEVLRLEATRLLRYKLPIALGKNIKVAAL